MRYFPIVATVVMLATLLAPTASRAQFGPRTPPAGETSPTPRPQATASDESGRAVYEHAYETGFRLQVEGNATGVVALFPVPREWDDQQAELIDQQLVPKSAKLTMVQLPGATLARVRIDRLAAGDQAEVILRYRVRRLGVQAPEQPESLELPIAAKLGRDSRIYLTESPMIQSRDPRIAKVVEELVDDDDLAWQRAQRLYDFVHEHVTYEEGPMKGAIAALEDRRGDCEEMTALFVALSRASGIPARTVWVPGHCYPEFLLSDAKGGEVWTAVEMTNEFPFGVSPESRPILQKGDSFRVPGNRRPQHYVQPELRIQDYQGTDAPKVEWIPAQDKLPPSPPVPAPR